MKKDHRTYKNCQVFYTLQVFAAVGYRKPIGDIVIGDKYIGRNNIEIGIINILMTMLIPFTHETHERHKKM